MNHDELMKMLGLDAKPIKKPLGEDIPFPDCDFRIPLAEETSVGNLPVGDTCYNLDRWELEQGTRLGMSSNRNVLTMSDFFAAAFRQCPDLDFECSDKQLHDFMTTLLESPDFNVLRTSTVANVLASDMAAEQFAQQFHKIARDEERRVQTGVPMSDGEKEIACLAAVGKALQQAQDEVDQLEDMQHTLGMGTGAGSDQSLDGARVAHLFKRVRNNGQLRRICELAGRYRRVAQSKQRQKTKHGYDDMVGVEMGGDVARLLPLEMALLADEDFELDAMRRLVERQSMCREYRGVESQAKGPIVVCVDESGSMSGDPVCNAKAFALAMAWIAQHQNRWCALISYSGGTEGKVLVLPPRKWDQMALTDWLTHFYGGGTEMDVPLRELPTRYWQQIKAPRGKTDVIILTDAICYVPDRMRDQFNEWKRQEKVRCISMIIGCGVGAGGLSEVSDEVHNVSTINPDSDAVLSCFSV